MKSSECFLIFRRHLLDASNICKAGQSIGAIYLVLSLKGSQVRILLLLAH